MTNTTKRDAMFQRLVEAHLDAIMSEIEEATKSVRFAQDHACLTKVVQQAKADVKVVDLRMLTIDPLDMRGFPEPMTKTQSVFAGFANSSFTWSYGLVVDDEGSAMIAEIGNDGGWSSPSMHCTATENGGDVKGALLKQLRQMIKDIEAQPEPLRVATLEEGE